MASKRELELQAKLDFAEKQLIGVQLLAMEIEDNLASLRLAFKIIGIPDGACHDYELEITRLNNLLLREIGK